MRLNDKSIKNDSNYKNRLVDAQYKKNVILDTDNIRCGGRKSKSAKYLHIIEAIVISLNK